MLSQVLEQFVEESPITVMAQTLMSRIFAPELIYALFEKYAQRQYQQDLLFSNLVDLMSTVVCSILKLLASKVYLKGFRKIPRGEKKPKATLIKDPNCYLITKRQLNYERYHPLPIALML